MDELEGRLRSALAEMAEEVPPSHHAWAEHQRRVAAKSRRDRRRPVLMAAAAAAVVALIAVPTLILNTRGTGTEQAGQAPPASSSTATEPTKQTRSSLLPSPKYVAKPGETVVTEPFLLAGSVRNGVISNTFAYTVRTAGQTVLCVVTQPTSEGQVVDGTKVHPDFCAPLNRPAQGRYFWSGAVVVPQASDIYLFVASPPTDKILLRESDGSYAAGVRCMQSGEFTVFCTAGGLKKPTAYSALDPAGVALEHR